jgi:hypothetical protein
VTGAQITTVRGVNFLESALYFSNLNSNNVADLMLKNITLPHTMVSPSPLKQPLSMLY